MSTDNSAEENEIACSSFVLRIVQYPNASTVAHLPFAKKPPKRIVQFWDDLDRLPNDVQDCINTWKKLDEQGFDRILFDKHQARDFIRQNLGRKHTHAYDKCYHPAMQSDYFRLCYIAAVGGCYIDTDDVYNGSQIQHLFDDGRLKVQPLCYDKRINMMVAPSTFSKPGVNEGSWIVYFNNNPLIACSGHPIVEHALAQATISLEKEIQSGVPEIQSITGPGNLTKSIFELADKCEDALVVLSNWEDIASSKWELSYRNDARNWRHVFWK